MQENGLDFKDLIKIYNYERNMTTNKIVSYIEADKGDNLYIVIDRSDEESVGFPVRADEVEVIMRACMVYLSDKGSNG
jgi:hypothetical protein